MQQVTLKFHISAQIQERSRDAMKQQLAAIKNSGLLLDTSTFMAKLLIFVEALQRLVFMRGCGVGRDRREVEMGGEGMS